MIRIGNPVKDAKVNVLGLTFKEDVSRSAQLACHRCDQRTEKLWIQVFVHDPVPDPGEAHREYGLELVSWDELPTAEAMVVAVRPSPIPERGCRKRSHAKIVKGGCFIDVKSQFDREALSAAGLCVWRPVTAHRRPLACRTSASSARLSGALSCPQARPRHVGRPAQAW